MFIDVLRFGEKKNIGTLKYKEQLFEMELSRCDCSFTAFIQINLSFHFIHLWLRGVRTYVRILYTALIIDEGVQKLVS